MFSTQTICSFAPFEIHQLLFSMAKYGVIFLRTPQHTHPSTQLNEDGNKNTHDQVQFVKAAAAMS